LYPKGSGGAWAVETLKQVFGNRLRSSAVVTVKEEESGSWFQCTGYNLKGGNPKRAERFGQNLISFA